jgi:DnaJ-class molecular chaperone
MKDYYKTLEISEEASDEDIRRAFRRLAFRYHPDKNIGYEKQAEARFKDINEAYGVLSDSTKRKQYDMARKGVFARSGYHSAQQGFGYSQEDIFRDAFTNQANLDELNRMFAQAGLRFDQDFLNRVFFGGNRVIFRMYNFGSSAPAGNAFESEINPYSNQAQTAQSVRKPNWLERFAAKVTIKLANFALKNLFGIRYQKPLANLHEYRDLKISREEAQAGGEKQFSYKINGTVKKLAVKIPSGIKPGTQIRLRGMGKQSGQITGDLYLKVKVG